MDDLGPLVVPLMFILRCLVPLAIMLGLSYLLKRLGLIKEPHRRPPDEGETGAEDQTRKGGGPLHGQL